MYTATLIGDTKNIELRRRMVNIEFTDGVTTFAKEFQFKIDETLAVMKNTVKQYLDELNFTPPTITDLTPDAEVAPVPPTVEELARTEYDADVARLKKAQELLDMGVPLKPAVLTALDTLRTKIANNVKAEYLG